MSGHSNNTPPRSFFSPPPPGRGRGGSEIEVDFLQSQTPPLLGGAGVGLKKEYVPSTPHPSIPSRGGEDATPCHVIAETDSVNTSPLIWRVISNTSPPGRGSGGSEKWMRFLQSQTPPLLGGVGGGSEKGVCFLNAPPPQSPPVEGKTLHIATLPQKLIVLTPPPNMEGYIKPLPSWEG